MELARRGQDPAVEQSAWNYVAIGSLWLCRVEPAKRALVELSASGGRAAHSVRALPPARDRSDARDPRRQFRPGLGAGARGSAGCRRSDRRHQHGAVGGHPALPGRPPTRNRDAARPDAGSDRTLPRPQHLPGHPLRRLHQCRRAQRGAARARHSRRRRFRPRRARRQLALHARALGRRPRLRIFASRGMRKRSTLSFVPSPVAPRAQVR